MRKIHDELHGIGHKPPRCAVTPKIEIETIRVASMVSSLFKTIALVGVAALAGCSWLPSSGPLTADILDHYQDKDKPSTAGIKLVELNTELIAAANAVVQPNHAMMAANKPVPPDTISIGDVLSISI